MAGITRHDISQLELTDAAVRQVLQDVVYHTYNSTTALFGSRDSLREPAWLTQYEAFAERRRKRPRSTAEDDEAVSHNVLLRKIFRLWTILCDSQS